MVDAGLCRAFVLTGGKSSRMGRDKALMEVGGRPLVLYVSDVVARVVPSITLVGSRAKYGSLGLPVVEDVLPGQGPLSGIHAALKDSRTPLNLVLGCDMPFLNAPFLEMLIMVAAVADAKVTVTESAEFGFESLCAVFNREGLPQVEESLNAGDLKLSRVYEKLRVRTLSAEEWRPYNPHGDLFRNVNTLEDFEKAWRRLEAVAQGGAGDRSTATL